MVAQLICYMQAQLTCYMQTKLTCNIQAKFTCNEPCAPVKRRRVAKMWHLELVSGKVTAAKMLQMGTSLRNERLVHLSLRACHFFLHVATLVNLLRSKIEVMCLTLSHLTPQCERLQRDRTVSWMQLFQR